jgi:hypothetical protein
MFTYLAIQMAIKASKRVKAVIAVVEECQLTTEKGAAFKSIAQTVSSMFRGASYQSSFFLIFNKGQKNQRQLLSTMRRMEVEMREGSEKEKNPLIAEGYKKIEAVLSIFNHSGNVIPFSPHDPKSRNVLLQMINNSPPVPNEALGCAVDSKNGQQLNKILCDIAGNGKMHLEGIKNSNDSLQELSTEIRSNLSLINDLENKIQGEEDKIKAQRNKITTENNSIVEQRSIISTEEQKRIAKEAALNAAKANIDFQNTLITKEESSAKSTEGQIENKLNLLNNEKDMIRRQEKVIDEENIKIKEFNKSCDEEEEKIGVEKNKIKTLEADIDRNNYYINSIDTHSDVINKIDVAKQIKASLDSKEAKKNQAKRDIESAQSNINHVENLTNLVLINSVSYDEHTVYGTVQRGTVKSSGELLSLTTSGTVKVSKYERDGGIYCSLGSNGYFTQESQSTYSASVVYYGPSHSYGWAKLWIYAEQRHTVEAQRTINDYKTKLQIANSIFSQVQSDYDSELDKYNSASSNICSQRTSTKSSLEAQNATYKSQITNANNVIANCNNVINSNNSSIVNCRNMIAAAQGVITTSKNTIINLENSKETAKIAIEASLNLIKSYRNEIATANNSIATSKDAIASSKCLINTANDTIRTCNSSIDSCNSLIKSFEDSIGIFTGNISDSKDKILNLKNTVCALSNTIDHSEVSLNGMEAANKFKMLSTICDIMGLNLEIVHEFETLFTNFPNFLINYKTLLQEIQGLNCIGN